MVTYLLKKSYQLKDLKQIKFHDLWGNHGIFTTMWIFGKPPKILFLKSHLKNLISSLKKYQISKKTLRADILEIINKNLSKKKRYNHLLRIAVNKKIPLLYASSASTYGGGENGFSDNHKNVKKLKPLNLYGLSKQKFDEWVLEQSIYPPRWYGLKYFNVYGPGENHKGRMASPILKFKNQLEQNKQCNLFKAYGGFNDGEHLRDFVYIDDVIDVTLWSMFDSSKSGIYNVGTSRPSTFNQIANTLIKNLGSGSINYVEFPDDLKNKYQPFTSADISQLREAGYEKKFCSLEEGINKYLTFL